jgi:hypothetical protein
LALIKSRCTVLLFLLFVSSPLIAADHFVLVGAGGSANGSDWTNAWTNLPATLTRGDIYYIGDGSYGNYTFDDAVSSTSVITIKKATAADHGTETGWVSTMGDGQAVFGTMEFTRGYYTINGVTRNDSDWQADAYGFRITAVYSSSINGSNATNLIVQYADIGGTVGDICASAAGKGTTGVFAVITGLNSWTISRCHIHNVSLPIVVVDADNWIVEYSHLGPSWAKEAISAQQTSGWTIRHNKFIDNLIYPPAACEFGGDTATADIWTRDENGENDGWLIYGNVFGDSGTYNNINRSQGIVMGNYYSGPTNTVSDWKVYNNTFYNIQGGQSVIRLGSGSGNTVANNLWYKSRTSDQTIGILNAGSGALNYTPWCYSTPYSLCASSPGTWVAGSEDPFVDSANYNFQLKSSYSGPSPRDAGTALTGVDAVDRYGNTRGADGTWDIGAYEYDSGEPDTTDPTVTITSPTSSATYATSVAAQTISGTCTDDTACTAVTWTCDNCTAASGTATGTASWSQALTFNSGAGTVVITGVDAAANDGTDQIVVTYTEGTASGSRSRMRR